MGGIPLNVSITERLYIMVWDIFTPVHNEHDKSWARTFVKYITNIKTSFCSASK